MSDLNEIVWYESSCTTWREPGLTWSSCI